MSISYRAWDGNKSLTDQLRDKGYGDVLDQCLMYKIYVGKGGEGSGWYHHYIVVKAENTRYLIFELTAEKTNGAKVVAGLKEVTRVARLRYQKSLECTLR